VTPVPIRFSLVIPAYNEARRLPPFLQTVRAYLPSHYAAYEVLVVDDGSRDGLAAALEPWLAEWPQLRLLRHATNQGKGAAVRTGMLAAQGECVLFADADGATPIAEEARLRAALAAGADVAVGSRLLPAEGVTRRRTMGRGLLGRLFSAFSRRLLRLTVRDTQCGFKMFRRPAARRIFERIAEPGYLFDLEVLLLAAQLGCRVVEVPIDWHDVAGSHLHPIRDFGRILGDLWRIRRRRPTAAATPAEVAAPAKAADPARPPAGDA